MQRRTMFSLSCAAALAVAMPGVAQAQRVARIGLLGAQGGPLWKAFTDELKQVGWEEGRNLIIDVRFRPDDPHKYRAQAEELVAVQVELIVASSDPAVAAAYKATQSIPIVMLGSGPVERGYAKSLTHPGGNVTGVAYQSLDFTGKEFSLLKEMRPDLKKVGIPFALGSNPVSDAWFKGWQSAGGSQAVAVVPLPDIRGLTDVEPMLAAAKREGVQALVVGPKYFLLGAGWQQIQAWAIENKVLTNSGTWTHGEAVLAYGFNTLEVIRIAVRKVDRILRGAKPAELPIEQPTRFELIVNEKLAKAIGLTVPRSVLLQATEVIR